MSETERCAGCGHLRALHVRGVAECAACLDPSGWCDCRAFSPAPAAEEAANSEQ